MLLVYPERIVVPIIYIQRAKKDPATGERAGSTDQPVERLSELEVTSELHPQLGCIAISRAIGIKARYLEKDAIVLLELACDGSIPLGAEIT